jgi:hypothetical protein
MAKVSRMGFCVSAIVTEWMATAMVQCSFNVAFCQLFTLYMPVGLVLLLSPIANKIKPITTNKCA